MGTASTIPEKRRDRKKRYWRSSIISYPPLRQPQTRPEGKQERLKECKKEEEVKVREQFKTVSIEIEDSMEHIHKTRMGQPSLNIFQVNGAGIFAWRLPGSRKGTNP